MPYTADSVPSYVPKGIAADWAAQWNAIYAKGIGEGKSKEDAEKSAFAITRAHYKEHLDSASETAETVGQNPDKGSVQIVADEALDNPATKPPVVPSEAFPVGPVVKSEAHDIAYNHNPNTPVMLNPDTPLTRQDLDTGDVGRDKVRPQDSNPTAAAPADAITIIASEIDPYARIDAQAAGYEELEGAVKDADCNKVQVAGGVSSLLGCCNLFKRIKKADEFRCGECIFVVFPRAQAEVEKDEKVEASAVELCDQTLENLKAAYAGEANAHARYLAFAAKAEEEKLPLIAKLLRAIASEENHHLQNFAAVLNSKGVSAATAPAAPQVGTTLENLQYALSKGERVERDTTYPAYAKQAEADKLPNAVSAFQEAIADETRHAELLKRAVESLKTGSPLTLSDRELMPFAVLLSQDALPVTALDGQDLYDIPLAYTGDFHKGQPFSITNDDLDSMEKNFKKRLNGHVVVDYEHASEHPFNMQGQPIPAAGWIRDIYKKGNYLVGRVQWTPKALGMIRTGEYRFFSPAINWDAKDKGDGSPQGATLTSGALTNHPFLEGLPPILLSEKDMIDVGQAHVPAAMGKGAPQKMDDADPTVDAQPPVQPPAGETGGVAISNPPAASSPVPAGASPTLPTTEGAKPVSAEATPVVSASSASVEAPLGLQPGESKAAAQSEASEGCMATELRANLDMEHASVGGEAVHRSNFLYVGDPDKKETWALPVHDDAHIRNALARFNQTSTIPSGEKGKVAKKLVALAKKHGIDTSGFEKSQKGLLGEYTMKSQVKKIADGAKAGRFGRFDESGKLLTVLPSGLNEAQMAEYCAELDESDPAAGSAQPGPAHVEPEEAKTEPAGAFLADGKDAENDDDADDKKLSASEVLRLITYPAGHKQAGRVNLSEVTKLVRDGRVDAATIFEAQAAESAVSAAIQAGKFLPKQRPTLMKQALSDIESFNELAASTPRIAALTNTLGLGANEEVPASGELDKAVKQELSEHKDDKSYDYSAALADVTKRDPELWARYREEVAGGATSVREFREA